MSDINQRVGRKIKQAREALNMTQAELADVLGYSQNTVAGWESGRRSCRLETIYEICSATKQPIGFFTDFSDYAYVADSGPSIGRESYTLGEIQHGFQKQLERFQQSLDLLEGFVDELRADKTGRRRFDQ